MLDPLKPLVAVAVVRNSTGNLLLTWNAKWRCFTTPMTKIDQEQPGETPEAAAVRAIAEVLGVPAQPVAGQQTRFLRGLQLSRRDDEIKDYQYHAVKVEPHPDFANVVQPTVAMIWANIDKLLAEDYQPVSQSVAIILRDGFENGWL